MTVGSIAAPAPHPAAPHAAERAMATVGDGFRLAYRLDGPAKPLRGVGGAMDLASGAKRLVVLMMHTTPKGAPKIVPQRALPLTARGVVDLANTNLAAFVERLPT